MNTALSALRRFPFEMLHHIRDVNLGAVDVHFFEDFIEQATRGTDKRMAGAIFGISRLLADEHDACLRRTFPENRLSRIFPKIASLAGFSRSLKIGKSQSVRDGSGNLFPHGFALRRNIRSLRRSELWLQIGDENPLFNSADTSEMNSHAATEDRDVQDSDHNGASDPDVIPVER